MATKGEGRGWRPGGGSKPVRVGAKAEWMPVAEKPRSRTRRYKQAALVFLGLLLIGAGVWLYYFLLPPTPPVLLVITTDPAADATNLGAPIDPYGWLSSKDLVKWSERYTKDAPAEKKRHVPAASDGSGELKNNDTIKSEEDLARWAAGKAHASFKPSETAIIYFGLHTGADSLGPFLYANQGRQFQVRPLLKALAKEMGSRTQVLVLFDPSRQLPDPARGQLTDGFVDGVKSLADEIASLGNITVILGCDSGERGWESEELQRTAFAHAVIEGLGGKAHPREGNTITAADLFDYVKAQTEEWTRRNRPTVQHPIMIPATDSGLQQAAATKLALHHELGEEQRTPPADPMAGLDVQWKAYGEIAGGKEPDPEVYAPRRWRRYRDLLLRYEFVARSGELTTLGAVEEALRKEAGEIRKALQVQVLDKSALASNQMWQAAGRQPPADAASALREPGNRFLNKPSREMLQEFTDKLQTLTADRVPYSNDLIEKAIKPPGEPAKAFFHRAELLREVWKDQPVRPSDVQLVLMLDQFHREHVKEDPPEEVDPKGSLKLWQRAVQVRRKAEDAALGPTAVGHPYSEVIWRCVQASVAEGDVHRRKAEDALFAPTGAKERAEAWSLFEEALKYYQRAAEKAQLVRTALALRDRIMADLPYLGRWSVFEGEEKIAVDAKELWKEVHGLARLLDKLPPDSPAGLPAIEAEYQKLRDASDKVATKHEKLVKDFNVRLNAEADKTNVIQQNIWLERERLLAVPPIKDSLKRSLDGLGLRASLIRVNRKATAYLINPQNVVNTKADEQGDRSTAKKDRAIALGFLGLHELGTDLMEKQFAANDANSSWEAVKNEVNKIREGGKWDDTALAGERLGKHYRTLADAVDPAATASDANEAERFSRIAVSFNHREGAEPAEVNRKLRWQKLLAAQALRTVSDHWYDGERPYYQTIAKAFTDDAEALTPADPTRVAEKKSGHDLKSLLALPDEKFNLFEKLRKAEPLRLQATAGDARWTTEAQKSVGFAISAAALPDDARPVVWGEFVSPKDPKDRKVDFTAGIDSRKILPIKSGVTPLPLTLAADPAMSLKRELTIQRSAFFRGQYTPVKTDLALSRMPDLVTTHARPQEGDPLHPPRAAFVGPNDIDVGAVTIVIDYSPSMTVVPQGGQPRITKTWEALRVILNDLPDGTKLTIRGFGVAPGEKDVVEAEDFESVYTAGGTDAGGQTWPGTHDRVLVKQTVDWRVRPDSLTDLMTSLIQTKPGGPYTNSPVVRSLLRAARKDFDDAKDHQTKVIVVITDGADNSCWKPKNVPVGALLDFEPLGSSIEKEFRERKGRGITARLLLIKDEQTKKDEQVDIDKFVKQINPVLQKLDPPGRVQDGSIKELGTELAELLRPRVRLNRNGTVLPENLRAGVPLRFDNRKPRPEPPEWTGMPSPGEFEAWVGQKPPEDQRQTLAFASADSLLVRLSRPEVLAGVRGRVQFERVVWGREGDFGRALRLNNRQQERTEQNWLLSAAMYRTSLDGYGGEQISEEGRHTLDLRAALENIDPVRLKPAEGQFLKQIAPDFVWWELSPSVELNKRSPVYIWRECGHPAPVWRMRRWDWTDKGNEPPKATLRGWLPQQLKLPAPRQTTTLTEVTSGSSSGRQPDGGTWAETWAGELDDGQKWTAKFSWEQHAFATNPDSREPDKLKLALVVRVYLDDPKKAPPLNGKPAPLFVQVADARIEEHRYFRDAGAYTGYFHFGPSTVADPAANKEVKLFAAIDLLKPGVGVPFELPLPKPDVQGEDPVWKIWESYAPKLP